VIVESAVEPPNLSFRKTVFWSKNHPDLPFHSSKQQNGQNGVWQK